MQCLEEGAVNDLREYESATKKAARKLVRHERGSLDATAHDREDYELMLLVEAWKARTRFRSDERVGHGEDEKRYCFAAVWNAARDFHGSRCTRAHATRGVSLDDTGDSLLSDFDIEARYSAVQTIALLRDHFTDQEWDVLEHVAVSGGNVREAFEGRSLEELRRGYVQVDRLRKRASALLRRSEE
jgi:hypothetical protein